MPLKSQVQNLLSIIAQIIKTDQKHANANGEYFNIFTILNMRRKEVETHSQFIYELLNPKGLHGQGDIFLKLFLTHVLNIPDVSDSYIVKREDLTTGGRRIDLTIELDGYMIGIEMKIDAGDQPGQLYDYHEELKRRANGREIKLFYLTLDGKEASESSLKNLKETDYQTLAFQYEILLWLEKCIQASALKHVLREALVQYKLLIESLTGLMTGVKMDIANELIASKQNFESAIMIEKALIESKIMIHTAFWKAVLAKLKTQFPKYQIEFHGNSASIEKAVRDFHVNSRNNKNFGYKFRVGSYEKYSVFVYINVWHRAYYGIRLENSEGKVVGDANVKKAMREHLTHGNAISDSESDWIVSHYFESNSGMTEIDFKKFNAAAISFADKEELEKRVNAIVAHMGGIVDELDLLIPVFTM